MFDSRTPQPPQGLKAPHTSSEGRQLLPGHALFFSGLVHGFKIVQIDRRQVKSRGSPLVVKYPEMN